MKFYILLLSVLMFLSCESQKTPSNSAIKSCESKVEVGSSHICLVNLDGMKEVYSDLIVKDHIDRSEPNVLKVLGVYLTNDKYANIEEENGFIINNQEVFSDRFKLYIAKNMIDASQNPKELESFYNRTVESITNPIEIKDLLNSEFKDVQYDVPQFIKNYKLDENAYSFVAIIKVLIPETNQELVRVSIITMMNLNGKAVNLNYITDYVNEETIEIAIKKNEKFTTKILELNN